MTRRGIFRFEIGYQARRPWPYLFALVLLAISFLMARDTGVADAMYEAFYANSPFAIAKTMVFGGLFWLLVAAAVAGESAARDVATRMYPLVYTTPASKGEYLVGRFAAALLINAILLLAVPVGIMLGVYAPGVPAASVGPFRAAAYITAYAYIGLPLVFVGTALHFAIALRSGRVMASYAGSLLLVFTGFFVATLVRLTYSPTLGSMLDPIGINYIVDDLAHDWTQVERNVRLIGLEGVILVNRSFWIGIGAIVCALAYLRFRFAHRTESDWRRRSKGRGIAAAPVPGGGRIPAPAPALIPAAAITPSAGVAMRRTLGIAWVSFRAIATSWAGLALLILVPVLTVVVVLDQLSALQTPLMPTTARVLAELTAPLSAELSRWVIVPLALAFFAGELVWRERDSGIAEITDAMPGSDWIMLLGKFLGLGLVVSVLLAMLAAAGMVAQTIRGYDHFEIGLYAGTLFGLQLPEYLLFALLALAIHAIVGQKYVGHLVAIMAYGFIAALATSLGIEHNMLVYGAGPTWSYTDMRGFGASIGPWLWFKGYWAAWAMALAVAARLLWSRGAEHGTRVRLGLARARLAGGTAWTAGIAAAMVAAVGGVVFYNTNVLNRYRSSAENAGRSAEYERRYRRYESAPQPRLTATTLRVEIDPGRRTVDIHGRYRLVNERGASIDSIHVTTATEGITRSITLDRPATLVRDDEEHGFRIYALARPLPPGDTLDLDFQLRVAPRGFGNRGTDPWVTARGSYFTNRTWFPLVGYQRFRELLRPSERREHGLPPRAVLASLAESEDESSMSRGGGVVLETVMGTEMGQTAVAPGALQRTWDEGARRYFAYATEAPIGSEWSFFSAAYAVQEARSGDVVIRHFHSPGDTTQLDRMLRGARASLEYYAAQFGRYPYRFLTLVENPAAPGTGAHADAGMISYGQGFAQWVPEDDGASLDLPYAILGHEMAHQWTLPYALVEGLPFLSEGLAWYSAMQLVKTSRGADELARLAAFMRRPYPFRPIRRGEPLLRALDPYLAYRRGPFAMYALSAYAGTERVNGAIRRLIATHEAAGAPPATTSDLYRELGASLPDSVQYLLRDLFEVNTFWDLTATDATARALPDGTWQVRLGVRARKTVVDSVGTATDRPLADLVEIGVFADPPRGTGTRPLRHLQMVRVRAGEETVTVTVPWKPQRAGVDPNGLLEWTDTALDDNVVAVRAASGPSARPTANSGGAVR